MTAVSILPENLGGNGTTYRAVAGAAQSVGRTPGEALDALTSQLDAKAMGTLVIVQQFQPDEFFTEEQQQRLGELMARWRAARDAGTTLPRDQQAELEALVQAELKASGQRAAALVRALSS